MDESNSKIHKLAATTSQAESAERKVPLEIHPASENFARFQDQYIDEEIDLYQVWILLKKYKVLLASIITLSVVVSLGYAFFTTPLYRSEVVVASVSAKDKSVLAGLSTQFGGLASLAGVDIGGSDNTLAKQLAGLESRAFIIPFLDEQQLLPILFADKWDSTKQNWAVGENETPTLLTGYEYFVEKVLSVSKSVKTGLITLSIDWEDPEKAANWANQLISAFNDYQRKLAIRDAEKSITYLNKQLEETKIASVQEAISRLIESQTEVIMLANVKQDYALQVLDPAVPMEKAHSPNKTLIVILGGLLGCLSGLFSVFVVNFFHTIAESQRKRS